MGKAIRPDFYISANQQWMDRVVRMGLVHPSVVTSPWGNRLQIATPKNSTITLNSLAGLNDEQITKILIGDPGTAPFGRYAKQALSGAEIWSRVRGKIGTRKHITLLADEIAEQSDGVVGILFSSKVQPPLKTILEIPEELHPPIRYYAAPLTRAQSPELAAAFSDFLQSDAATLIAEKGGFTVIDGEVKENH